MYTWHTRWAWVTCGSVCGAGYISRTRVASSKRSVIVTAQCRKQHRAVFIFLRAELNAWKRLSFELPRCYSFFQWWRDKDFTESGVFVDKVFIQDLNRGKVTLVSVELSPKGRIQNMDPVHGPDLWTTPNFQTESAPVNMKIYLRSGYEKYRLVFIAYILRVSLVTAGCFGIAPHKWEDYKLVLRYCG